MRSSTRYTRKWFCFWIAVFSALSLLTGCALTREEALAISDGFRHGVHSTPPPVPIFQPYDMRMPAPIVCRPTRFGSPMCY